MDSELCLDLPPNTTQLCHISCPVECEVSAWSAWGPCTYENCRDQSTKKGDKSRPLAPDRKRASSPLFQRILIFNIYIRILTNKKLIYLFIIIIFHMMCLWMETHKSGRNHCFLNLISTIDMILKLPLQGVRHWQTGANAADAGKNKNT